MRSYLSLLPLIIFLPPVIATASVVPADLPMPEFYVEDRADVIDSDHQRALNGLLQELEHKTGAQYVILTIQSTGGLPIEQFSIELLDRWQLGRAGRDDGLLFTLALQDRAYRFEVGQGLEGVIPDQFAARIGREVLEPLLQRGEISQGIYEANRQIARRIAENAGVTLTGTSVLPQVPYERQPVPGGDWTGCACPCCAMLVIFFLVMFLFGGGRRRRGIGMGWGGLLFLPLLFRGFGGRGGYGRSGSYGGGSFGGGFGGFGGGMRGGYGRFGGGRGGRFGGRGASGRW